MLLPLRGFRLPSTVRKVRPPISTKFLRKFAKLGVDKRIAICYTNVTADATGADAEKGTNNEQLQ